MPSSYLLKNRDTSTRQHSVLALARKKSLFKSELLNTATTDLNLFAMSSQLFFGLSCHLLVLLLEQSQLHWRLWYNLCQ